jgi:C-terminal domain 6 of the ABC-three component (ABC-3C) systems
MSENELRDLKPNPQQGLYSDDHVISGIPIPKQARIEKFSDSEWEEFSEEYAFSLKDSYYKVQRFGGAGDKGIDVACFINDHTFEGGWDNYQCKFYDHSLYPGDVLLEFGKVIYYSFSGDYPVPNRYFFVAPQGIGTTLAMMIAKPDELKEKIKENWSGKISSKISSKFDVPLTGDLLKYFENFDFSIFDSISVLQMIASHVNTPFHAVRFGGGLPVRPESQKPPEEVTANEKRYIDELLLAYGDCENEKKIDSQWLEANQKYKKNIQRQRERFYSAESLRNFSRDNVPSGTFDNLQEEVYQGVIDICEVDYENGFERMTATVGHSASLSIDSSPLRSVTKIIDKQGICHQLVNKEKLKWVGDDE